MEIRKKKNSERTEIRIRPRPREIKSNGSGRNGHGRENRRRPTVGRLKLLQSYEAIILLVMMKYDGIEI